MTLDEIKARCVEEGDCWLWTGNQGVDGRHPRVSIDGKIKLVRRVAYALKQGKLSPKHLVMPVCGNPKCVNPEHQRALTESQKVKRVHRSGAYLSVTWRRNIAMNRRKLGKLTPEIAAAIRESDESGSTLAKRYEIAKSLVGAIKRGERWKEYTTSPFAGLAA